MSSGSFGSIEIIHGVTWNYVDLFDSIAKLMKLKKLEKVA